MAIQKKVKKVAEYAAGTFVVCCTAYCTGEIVGSAVRVLNNKVKKGEDNEKEDKK